MSFLVDANENRDVATADVAEVFLKSVMEEDVLMRLAGEEIDIHQPIAAPNPGNQSNHNPAERPELILTFFPCCCCSCPCSYYSSFSNYELAYCKTAKAE